MYSCLWMKVMMVNKCCKFQSNICNGFDKTVNWYKTLNQGMTPRKDELKMSDTTLTELFLEAFISKRRHYQEIRLTFSKDLVEPQHRQIMV